MSTLPRAIYDEEDAALSTFRVLCQKLQAGEYPGLADGEELWSLMLRILVRKVNRRAVYENAQKRSPTIATAGQHSESAEPAVSESAVVAEECEHLFRELNDPDLEQLVLWKLDGYTNEEIAEMTDRARSTIQRMLRLVRKVWIETNDEHQ